VPLLPVAPCPLPRLSIVVPVRDEARSIERCVRSLLEQRELDFEVIAVDDESRDSTPEILARLQREDARLVVVRGNSLPRGWIGKPWALHQGAEVARGSWLLFTDADSVHAPRSAMSALALATTLNVDALSILTFQELDSFWERALLPSILGLVMFVCGSFAEINDPRKPNRALLNGQYLLVSRAAYDALGGHRALRGEIAEDVEFARRLKADGRFRLMLASGESLAAVRMYRSLDEIWRGFTKNVFVGARGDLRAIAAGTLFTLAISAGPPLLAFRALRARRYAEALEASACTLATVASASWAFGKIKLPRPLGWYQPIGTAFFAAVTLNSTWCVLSGRGVEWRGRTYDGRPGGGTLAEP
jgi:chlorobactene glucosyltransferase